MFTSERLIEGEIYTRNTLRQTFSIKDATLNNGVFQPAGSQSIWLFVTEQKTNDRPQLNDQLEDDVLWWDGQPQGRTDKLIIEHEKQGLELLVFYRKDRNTFPGAGFKYEGRFRYVSHAGSHPAHFILQKRDSILETVKKDIEALHIEEAKEVSYKEGKLSSRLVNIHERNPQLRARAIEIYGTRCQGCDFCFMEMYGSHGEDYIEVHHLNPVADYTEEVIVDPSTDMAVVCANCHRMIHRNPEKPLSLDELRRIIIKKDS